jgi:antitoxin ParD1/3/4
MPDIEKISVALPSAMVAQVRKAVGGGEYASTSEVVREALRDWTRKRALQRQGLKELRKLWQSALEDSSPASDGEEVLDRLERRFQRRAEAGR